MTPGESSSGGKGAEDERIQLNVTLTRETLDKLREVYPVALEDSERIRQSVTDAIERRNATKVTLKHAE